MDILERARAVIRAESAAVAALEERLDDRFSSAVESLLSCKGRVITTGVGQAGSIARKLAAMEARGFTREDFAVYHPAGALGRRLTLRVSDVMRTGSQLAIVPVTALLRDAIVEIQKAGAGAVCLVDGAGMLAGLITDGDV